MRMGIAPERPAGHDGDAVVRRQTRETPRSRPSVRGRLARADHGKAVAKRLDVAHSVQALGRILQSHQRVGVACARVFHHETRTLQSK